MLVFLSWSGPRSKAVAEAMRDWLGDVIQAVEPWFSPDIEKGKHWTEEVTSVLERAGIGIICLTRDSLDSPLIHYEAGALAKSKNANAYTFLLDIKATEVKFPLAQFQPITATKADLLKLLHSVNQRVKERGQQGLEDERLIRNFERGWADLEKKLRAAAAMPTDTPPNVSYQGRRIHNLEEFVELWPRVLLRVRKKIGVSGVAYLHDARPVAFTAHETVLEYNKPFHYAKACEAAKRLPFEQVLNECFATPHQLKFRLAES